MMKQRTVRGRADVEEVSGPRTRTWRREGSWTCDPHSNGEYRIWELKLDRRHVESERPGEGSQLYTSSNFQEGTGIMKKLQIVH